MKKILMISGAALVAASAMAASPAKQVAAEGLKGAKLQRMDLSAKCANIKGIPTVEALKKSRLSILNQNFADEVTPGEDTEEEPTTPTLNARYYYPPINTFYAGSTPDGYVFPYQNTVTKISTTWGISGNKGVIPFLNLSTGATAYEWAYEFMGPTDNDFVPLTSEAEHLPVVIEGPYQIFTAPTLTAFGGEEQKSYTPQYVTQFLSGPDLAHFGVYPSNIFEDWAEAESEYDYWGVTTCPINIAQGKNTYTAEFSVNRKPTDNLADYYNENGACTLFADAIEKAYGEKYDIQNIRQSSFIAMLPSQTQAYLLDQTWFVPYYQSTADVTLTVTVYSINEEGVIDMAHPLGSGEVVIPAQAKAGAITALCELEAVDEEGFPTSNPLVIEGEACMFIEGFNDPAINMFTMFFNAGTEFDDIEAGVSEYYACNAAVGYEFDAYEKGVENAEKLYGSRIWNTDIFDYGKEAPFWGATDFNINYNILFPYVTNVEGGQDLSIVAPAEGGDVEYQFDAYFFIGGLMQEGLMTAECDADWLTYEAVEGTIEIEGQQYGVNQINVKAEALPEGVEGRQATIKYRGFASDFDLVVNQGDVSGISNVAAANGPVQYFDIQGRKLNAAPANGIYLERQGNKTVKKIAK